MFIIKVNGDIVASRPTLGECHDLAISRCWGFINQDGHFVTYPGVEIEEKQP